MNLMDCPDCGKEISTKAKSCPNCGCVITKKMIEDYESKFRNSIRRMKRKENEYEKWEKLGHSGLTLKIKDISLSQEEIKVLLKNKVLSKNLYNIFDIDYESNISQNSLKILVENANVANIFMILKISSTEFLLFAKDFMIICSTKLLSEKHKYKTNMDFPLVIPYSKVSKFNISQGNNVQMYFEPEYVEKKGDIAKGAMIGAIVAGTSGAIIGAAANLPKKVMTTPGKCSDVYKYTISISFKGCSNKLEFKLFNFDKVSGKFINYFSNDDWVWEINNILLNSNHSMNNLNLDEVTEICNEYIERFKEINDGATDYELRKKCIKYISGNDIGINEYSNNKKFILTVLEIIKESNDSNYSEIVKKIEDIISEVKKKNSEINNIKNQIKDIENKYSSLSFLKFSQKKELKNKKVELDEKLSNLKVDDYPDITKCLYSNMKNLIGL